MKQTGNDPINLRDISNNCRNCTVHELCLPLGLADDDIDKLNNIVKRSQPLHRGDFLFRIGDPLQYLYAIHSGSIKTYSASADGTEQITGFHLPGELIGLDAISDSTHPCAARALETTSVCRIPYNRLSELSAKLPSLHEQLIRVMSKEISTDQKLMMLLGKKTAEERLASLLLSISKRLSMRGFSDREFNLSMSRIDIANYLGLAVETVSRLFTRFHDEGLINNQRQHILIEDMDQLCDLAGASCKRLRDQKKVAE
ncbi:MAG: fumarate/nitrate reduction transcriptional regulator Fnr [Gammaproteobacteria bacterium]|nr:fumarate/nitrate reduction transcriptional regulator Fnr [Gammaproteobacteria bacterium]